MGEEQYRDGMVPGALINLAPQWLPLQEPNLEKLNPEQLRVSWQEKVLGGDYHLHLERLVRICIEFFQLSLRENIL